LKIERLLSIGEYLKQSILANEKPSHLQLQQVKEDIREEDENAQYNKQCVLQ
jgi:hypothetical protein